MSVIHFTDETFESMVLEGKAEALVDFWAPWCGPCKMLGPVVESLGEELGTSTLVGKVNIDEHPALAQKYEVMSIPTVISFRGGEEHRRIVGLVPKDKLLGLLK